MTTPFLLLCTSSERWNCSSAGLTVDSDVASCPRDANQSDWVQARLCRQGQRSRQGLKLHSRGQQALKKKKNKKNEMGRDQNMS